MTGEPPLSQALGMDRPMMRKLVIPALVIGASLLGATALVVTAPQVEPNTPEPVPPTVRVREARPKAVQLRVHSQGTVTPRMESRLIPEVSGRVAWISPALVNGGYFKRDETLLRLEDADYRSALQRAEAALARAEAEQEHARFEYQRMKSLEERQLASRSQMENAQRLQRVSEAASKEAQANMEQARRNLERTRIKAPFDGLVRDESVDLGQLVGPGGPVATLYAAERMEVRLPLADRQLAFLNLPIGQLGALPPALQPEVVLSAQYAGQALRWSGRIVRAEAQIDTLSRMVNIVAQVDEGERGPPAVGLFVSAEIQGLKVENIVVLPRSALRGGNRVLLVDERNRLRFRPVSPLRLYRDEVLIQSGLAPGELVCVSPMQTPIEGMPVNPILEAEAAS